MECDKIPGLVKSLVIRALIEAPIAWQTCGQLADRLGSSPLTVALALAELESSGWVVPWEEWPEGTAWTFTPSAAERLGIRICEVGADETPRWFAAGSPDPRRPKVKRLFRDAGALSDVIDPKPGPVELAIAKESRADVAPSNGKSRGAWGDSRRSAIRADEARMRRRAKRRARGNARASTCADD